MPADRESLRALSRRAQRALTDTALLHAVGRGDHAALEEFLLRFHPLLMEHARRTGYFRDESLSEHVSEVLEDVATLVMTGGIRLDEPVPKYLFTALRNRWFDSLKRRRRSQQFAEGHAEEAPAAGEQMLRSAHSEHTLRSSCGPDFEPPRLTPALERLATMLDDGLTDDERQILAWLSRFVPQRRIGEWLGISYAAAAQRIWRLRERLRDTAMEYAVSFDPDERRELRAFFRRSDIPYSDHLSHGIIPDAPHRRVAERPDDPHRGGSPGITRRKP